MMKKALKAAVLSAIESNGLKSIFLRGNSVEKVGKLLHENEGTSFFFEGTHVSECTNSPECNICYTEELESVRAFLDRRESMAAQLLTLYDGEEWVRELVDESLGFRMERTATMRNKHGCNVATVLENVGLLLLHEGCSPKCCCSYNVALLAYVAAYVAT